MHCSKWPVVFVRSSVLPDNMKKVEVIQSVPVCLLGRVLIPVSVGIKVVEICQETPQFWSKIN